MFIEFKVSNYRSFREEQILSFIASKDEKHPYNLIPVKGQRFSLCKVAALYGANASGKSNLIKALRFFRSFIVNSATKMNQGDEIPQIKPFRLDPKRKRKPSFFELSFIVDKIRFEYAFSATNQRVHKESLTAYPPAGRKQRWLEREFDPKTKKTTWAFRGPLKKDQQILKDKTRDNGLVLSRGAELNISSLSSLFLWFRNEFRVYDLSQQPISLMMRTAKRAKEDPEFQKRINRIIRSADVGIDDINVSEITVSLEDLPEEFQDLFSKKAIKKIFKNKQLRIQTIHRLFGSETLESFDFEEDESNGTQRLFALIGPFLDALNKGAVLIVDELECSMHPLLTRALLELFQSPEANRKGAQLLFATHDSTLMDSEIFRRDQIWIVEKTAKGNSELFSLYDFDPKHKPRNTEAFQRNYLAGRYGGIPKFGSVFEDLVIK